MLSLVDLQKVVNGFSMPEPSQIEMQIFNFRFRLTVNLAAFFLFLELVSGFGQEMRDQCAQDCDQEADSYRFVTF